MPAASVVLPTRNRATSLPRAIGSVLRQTCDDWELVVVDDGSADETTEVVGRYGDARVRLHRLPEPRGANAARNRGVELADGEFVSFLDSDDELHPEHLERVLEAFRSHRECAGVFTSFEVVRNGEPVRVVRAKDGFLTPREMFDDNVIGGFSCTTFRAALFDHIGKLDETLRSSQDYDFFLRVLKTGRRILGLDQVLATCHVDGDRIGNDLERALQGTDRILEKHGDVLTARGRSRLHYHRAFSYAHACDFRHARKAFVRTVQTDPTRWLAYLHLMASVHPTAFRLLLRAKAFVRGLSN